MDQAEIQKRFAYHSPSSSEIGDLHSEVRSECQALAEFLNEKLVDSREKSEAFTHLEDVMMWANACIARNQNNNEGE